jgi:SAM-dependent methyltransferase
MSRMQDTRTWSDLSRGRFRFLDAGCGTGGSIDHCARRFGRRPGLGIDNADARLDVARRRGYVVHQADLRSLEFPFQCVDFASLMDVLEHLPDPAAARRVLAAFGTAARDFVFIRHPAFDHKEYLAAHGLKLTWTDWSDHTNPMSLDQLQDLLDDLGWTDRTILPNMPITDSRHPAIVPLSAPRDTLEYDESLHGVKPLVTFNRVLYCKYDIFVRLNGRMDDAAWRHVAAVDGWQSEWEAPSPISMRDERANRRQTALGLEYAPSAAPADLLERLIPRPGLQHAEPSCAQQTVLQVIVEAAICQPWRYLLHFVHVLDAFNQASDVRRVLGIGRGAHVPGAFLAARFPELDVTVAQTGERYDRFRLSNLAVKESYERPDVPNDQYDFVFVLDEDESQRADRTKAGAAGDRVQEMLGTLAPGGWLHLVLIPAPGDERTPAECEATLCRCDYDELRSANIFATRISNALERLRGAMSARTADAMLANVVRLALFDLQPLRLVGFRQTDAIEYLLRRRSRAVAADWP